MSQCLKLQAQGFDIIPIGKNKRPINKNWQSLVGENRLKFEKPIDINRFGVGVITGQPLGDGFICALDIDVSNVNFSKQIRDQLTKLMHPLPIRVGEFPKFLVPFLCDQPTKKITSRKYKGAHIEVLGDGQFFIAHGPHPTAKTGKYEWFGPELSKNDLPMMTVEAVRDFIKWFEMHAERDGFERCGPSGHAADVRNVHQHFKPGDDFMADITPTPMDVADKDIVRALSALDCKTIDYDAWLRVGMALHHETEGDQRGLNHWAKWSATDPDRYDFGDLVRRYDGFSRTGANVITWRSVEAMTRREEMKTLDDETECMTDHGITERKADIDVHRTMSAPSASDDGERSRFGRWIDCDEFSDVIDEPDWLVRDVLETDSFCLFYGASGSGKSFWALKLAFAVATGKGFPVRETRTVAYMCGEGSRGVKKRIKALRQSEGVTGALLKNLKVNNTIIDFSDVKSVRAHVEALKEIRPSLLIIDTLARATGGLDENSTKDMNMIVKACDYIRRALGGCTVMLVHHSSKGNSQAARGSGSSRNAADVEIRCETLPGDAPMMKITNTKAKDGEPFADQFFSFERVEFDQKDVYGRQLYSAVLREADESDVDNSKSLTPNAVRVLKVILDLHELSEYKRATPPELLRIHGMEISADGICADMLKEYWRKQGEEITTKNPRRVLREAFKELVNKRRICTLDGVVVLFCC